MHFNLSIPETMEEALELKESKTASWLAGGTVLLVNAHQGKPVADEFISTEKLTSLSRITLSDSELQIGAGVTFDEIEKSTLVKTYARALWEAACEVGGPQIRHRATIGGNVAVASPASDGVTPLMALNARLVLKSTQGDRILNLTDFYIGKFRTAIKDNELLTCVIIPVKAGVSHFVKVGKRQALAVSSVNASMAKTEDGIRFCVGSSAPEVRFCEKTSEALSAGKLDEACRILQTEISPIDDRWGTAAYRRQVAENLMKKLYREMEEEA